MFGPPTTNACFYPHPLWKVLSTVCVCIPEEFLHDNIYLRQMYTSLASNQGILQGMAVVSWRDFLKKIYILRDLTRVRHWFSLPKATRSICPYPDHDWWPPDNLYDTAIQTNYVLRGIYDTQKFLNLEC